MKKFFAILVATVVVAISLLTCAYAEEPVVYDLMADFKAKNINSVWSIYNTGKADGTDAYTLKYWVNGSTDPGSGEPVDGLSAFGTALGAFPVCIVTAGNNTDKLTWCSAGDMGLMYITFTAPADGTYALDFSTNRMWNALEQYTPSRYFVKVNDGNPAEGFDVTTSTADAVNFTATYELEAGDVIYIGYDSVNDNGAADNSYINSCKVTYTAPAVNNGGNNNQGGTVVAPDTADGIVAAIALVAVAATAVVVIKRR